MKIKIKLLSMIIPKYLASFTKENLDNIEEKDKPTDTPSELAGLSSHYPFLILNVKQESYIEYQLSKCFGLTRPRNRIQVNRLRGRLSNHYRPRASKFVKQINKNVGVNLFVCVWDCP